MTELFLLSIASVFIIIFFSFFIFHTLNSFAEIIPSERELKEISIVIAARNEQNQISKLLDSLLLLDYPVEKYEIIFVDDNSIDETKNIISSFSERIPNLRLILASEKILPAKKGAMDIGIRSAKFNHIVCTDADCQIKKDWLKHFSDRFEKGFQFVFGNIIYLNRKKKFAGYFQQYENLRSKLLYFSAAKLNFPYSAGGANFGFLRSAFTNIGGYENITKTLSGDDDLLIQEAAKNNYKIGFILDVSGSVSTNVSDSFAELINRKARHTSASYYYSINVKIFLAIWHISNLLSFLSLLLIPVSPIFLLPFSIKIIIDTLTTAQFSEMFGYRFNIFQSITFQIIYESMIIFNFFNGFRFINRWK